MPRFDDHYTKNSKRWHYWKRNKFGVVKFQNLIAMYEPISLDRPDHCASNPCQNGGTCVGYITDIWCGCPERWRGFQCRIGLLFVKPSFMRELRHFVKKSANVNEICGFPRKTMNFTGKQHILQLKSMDLKENHGFHTWELQTLHIKTVDFIHEILKRETSKQKTTSLEGNPLSCLVTSYWFNTQFQFQRNKVVPVQQKVKPVLMHKHLILKENSAPEK